MPSPAPSFAHASSGCSGVEHAARCDDAPRHVKRYDVVVVGAGPAGTAAAWTLARAGATVALLERAVLPRDKCCGDGLTAQALREMEALGLVASSIPSLAPVSSARALAPSGAETRLDLSAPDGWLAATARRIDTDAALAEGAERAGARLVQRCRVVGIEPRRDGGVDVVDDTGRSWSADHAVAADGARSALRGQLDPAWSTRAQDDLVAARWLLPLGSARLEGALWIWMLRELLPGYAWAFPVGDGRVANVGIAVPARHPVARRLRRAVEELTETSPVASVLGHRPPLPPGERPRAWPIPATLARRGGLAAGRVLLVGDALGAADPMTGEGVAQALVTGRMAAEALLAAPGEGGLGLAERYSRQLRRTVGADDAVARATARVLRSERRCEWALQTTARTAFRRRWVGRWLFEDHPRGILLRPREWGREGRGLHRPGAFARPAPDRTKGPLTARRRAPEEH